MDDKELLKFLKAHEWNDVEFKQARQAIQKNAYASVPVFAYTQGGCLVFGVKKEGSNFEVVDVLDVDKTQNEFLSALRQKDIVWYRRQYEGKAGNRSYADIDDLEFLFQLGLIKETNKGRKPTIASVLLLGQDGYLRGLLPRPVIDCQRYLFDYNYYSTEERWYDRTVCDYNLIQSLLAVVEWYYKFAEIPFEVDPKTLQRKDTPPDYIAFREAIINMLIHQDYADHLVAQNLFIQIDKEFYELSPEILEQFKQIVVEAHDEVYDEVHDNLTKTEFQILNHCEYPHSTPSLSLHLFVPFVFFVIQKGRLRD